MLYNHNFVVKKVLRWFSVLPAVSHSIPWVEKFAKIYKPPQNSTRHTGGVHQVPEWGTTNIKGHRIKFSHHGALHVRTLAQYVPFLTLRHHSPINLEYTAPLGMKGDHSFRNILYLTHLMDYNTKMHKETREWKILRNKQINCIYTRFINIYIRNEVTKKN